jgi:hypothetical protein
MPSSLLRMHFFDGDGEGLDSGACVAGCAGGAVV